MNITHQEQKGTLTWIDHFGQAHTEECWVRLNLFGMTYSTRKIRGRNWTHAGHTTNIIDFTPDK